MTTQLSLYNGALRLLGERKLANLSEDRKPRYLLDDVWADGFVDSMLEQGYWNFAMRAVTISKSTTTIPAFGYVNAFDKPNDWIRTAGVSDDEFFNLPLLRYLEEVGFWFADVDPIYVRYISNASTYGNDFSRWPESFVGFAEASLAGEIALSLSQDTSRLNTILALAKQRRTEARSRDAMNEATEFLPPGTWTNARHGNRRLNRGKRSQLIG